MWEIVTELSNLLESYKKIKRDGASPTKDCYVLNIGGTTAHYNLNYSPCLTRSRCGSRGYWLSWLSRKMTVSEKCATWTNKAHQIFLTVQKCRKPEAMA